MNASPRRTRRALGGLLALSLAALVFILVRGISQGTAGPNPPPAPSRPPAPSGTPNRAGTALVPVPTVDPTLAAIVRPSLPEEWAVALLDEATQQIIGVSQTARADFIWLQQKGLWGPLSQEPGGVAIGGQVLSLDGRAAIEVMVPESPEPGHLISLGRIERQQSALILRFTGAGAAGDQPVRSLAGDIRPDDVLAALIREAARREVVLVAAYWETPGDEATLALFEIIPVGQQQPRLTPTPSHQTPASGTPTLATPAATTPTPSPTLIYQRDIRLTVQGEITRFIEDTPRSGSAWRAAVDDYLLNHAWVGLLTWDIDAGVPLVAGRSLSLEQDEADQLALFSLAQGDPAPAPIVLLQARWDGNGTEIASREETGQWYYGYRLPELVHWIILVAQEHGGQLTVAYDDVGSYRAITLIDFSPLPLPPGSS